MELTDCYLPKGHVLNQRYEVFDVIGSGGFGITYRAFDLLLNRFVAVKEFFIMQWMNVAGMGGNVGFGHPCRKAGIGQKVAARISTGKQKLWKA